MRVALLLLAAVLAAPSRAAAAPQPAEAAGAPVIAAIRVHGNLATPDETILEIAGVRPGMPFDDALPDQVAGRLRAAKRFDGVEVLKRFASISDPTQILLVIIVDDGPVAVDWRRRDGAADGGLLPIRRRSAVRLMVLPILAVEDGYGVSYGARLALTGRRGGGGQLAIPLTWGGHKRAAAEYQVALDRGPLTRVAAGAGVSRRENPFYEEPDDRRRIHVRGERRLAPALVAGVGAGWEQVAFAGARDRLVRLGADMVLDTRLNPLLPRDAVYARAAWERVDPRDGAPFGRRELDVRGYAGLAGQTVLVARGLREDANRPLPPYLQPLLGGLSHLRGFRAGFAAGDTLVAASLELRVPLTSPLGGGRAGVSAFLDAGTVYGAGERLRDQAFERGVGAEAWLAMPLLGVNLAVARGLGGGTRAHVSTSIAF
jgi:outer membrane protein assembly factor BamA